MPDRFPGWEAEWLNDVGDDFTRWRVSGGSAQFFLKRAASAYMEEFAYRHIRKRNHIPHTHEEHELMIYGDRLDGLPETLRNRFNSARDEKYKNTKKAPPGPMSGKVDLNTGVHETIARLRGEGYLYPDDNTPYSVDPRVSNRTLMTAGRMRAYPNVDYGAYTDEDRHQALLDLPQDLTDCARVLHDGTGAEIYSIAIWRGADGRMKFCDTATTRLRGLVNDEDVIEGIQRLLLLSRDQLAPMMGCTVASAPPAIYGAFDGSFRPRFPLINEGEWRLKCLLCEFFDYQYGKEYQGGILPIPWSDLDDPERGPNLVDPRRLPDQWPEDDLTNPLEWQDVDMLQRMMRHIHRGQSLQIGEALRFQFARVGETSFSEWVNVIAPGSKLRYNAASRLFVARMILANPDDVIAQREIAYQLPSPQSTVYIPFTDEFLQDARARLPEGTRARRLLDYTVEYEQGLPVQAGPGHWDMLAATTMCFPSSAPADDGDVSHLGGWHWEPKRFPTKHEKSRELFDIPARSVWLRDGHIDHPPSGTLLGGGSGLKWATLELLRERWTLDNPASNPRAGPSNTRRSKPTRARVVDPQADSATVDEDIDWLIERIVSSARVIARLRSQEYPKPPPETASQVDEVSVFVPPPLRPNKSIARDSRGPHHNYTPSPPPPSKTRGTKGKTRAKPRMSVHVEIPVTRKRTVKGKEAAVPSDSQSDDSSERSPSESPSKSDDADDSRAQSMGATEDKSTGEEETDMEVDVEG